MGFARRAIVSSSVIATVGLTGVAAQAVASEPAATGFTVATYEEFDTALGACGELDQSASCVITVAENLALPGGANPFYDGAANLEIRGSGDVVVQPDEGVANRFLLFDGEFTDATLTVSNLTFEGFVSSRVISIDGADQAYLSSLTFRDTVQDDGLGGALSIRNSTALIEDSTFVDNEATSGGAISVSTGELTIRDSHFRGGDSGPGAAGGIYAGDEADVFIEGSAFIDIEAWNGGAAITAAAFSTLEITSSVFASNGAGERVAIWAEGDFSMTHSTVISDYEVEPFHLPVNGAERTITASIVSAPDGTALCRMDQTTLASGGYNWLSTEDCITEPVPTDTVGSELGLLPVVASTGLVIPASDSPLRDSVPADACVGGTDFVGSVRPQGDGCEPGAVEIGDTEFADVKESHPFVSEVTWLAATGVTTGYEDGTFRPSAGVSRQAMAAFLFRFADVEGFNAPAVPTFSDVPVTHPFFEEIEWLASTGVTEGYPDGTFRPAAGVTRQAMAAFLFRLSGEPETAVTEAPFTDVPADHQFAEPITWLSASGISGGYADGTFRSTNTVSRQAMAAFLSRLELPEAAPAL